MARPRKEIDQQQFENLCALQCTEEEICGWFDVCTETLNSWCKRTYKLSFSEIFKQKRGKGKISLRRNQFRLAESNATMAIWLGKQYLNQRDQIDASVMLDAPKEDALSASLRALADEMQRTHDALSDTIYKP